MISEYPGGCAQGKGDPLVYSSYRTLKLLEQPMKVIERVLKKRIRCQLSIDDMQFGFMTGRRITKRHQARKKKLYYVFVDLEKEFNRVSQVIREVAHLPSYCMLMT